MNNTILAEIEFADGSKIEIKRRATGRDLLLAQKKVGKRQENLINQLLPSLLTLNGNPITPDYVLEMDVDLIEVIAEELITVQELQPVQTSTYPKEYLLGEKVVTLKEARKQKHNTEALRKSNNDVYASSFYILSELITIDDQPVSYDDLLDLEAGEVTALLSLLESKKNRYKVKRKITG